MILRSAGTFSTCSWLVIYISDWIKKYRPHVGSDPTHPTSPRGTRE